MKIKNNGFTLIELLAVIVILAIIAVIAVPIVLNIINDSKESATLRSAEMYIKSAELSIAQSTLKNKNITDGTYNLKDGDICLNTDCTDKLEVEVSGKVPDSGTITILNGSISELSLALDGKTIVKDSEGKVVFEETPAIEKGKFSSVCKPAKEQLYATNPLEAGYKYECEVKLGAKYNFYVLKTPEEGDTTINLIMDRNICEDGTPATAEKTCIVKYNSSGDASGTGPVTAMTYLNNATSSWKNIDNLNLTYDDEGTNFTGFALNGKARLPYKSEVADSNGSNEYLYENLDGSDWYGSGTLPTNNISGIYGYWTLSTEAGYSGGAWNVFFEGLLNGGNLCDGGRGVRAVINLKI